MAPITQLSISKASDRLSLLLQPVSNMWKLGSDIKPTNVRKFDHLKVILLHLLVGTVVLRAPYLLPTVEVGFGNHNFVGKRLH